MNIEPGLYIVSTPIGNLEDITIRALNTLKKSDVIICEDTRVTCKLLQKYSIQASMLVYNDKSNSIDRQKIIDLIEAGKIVSLVSDAGTPLVSDPGYKLVKEVQAKGLLLDIVPGPSAVIAALSISGLASDSFYFGGFLPRTSESRKKILLQLKNIPATLIFFESATRLSGTLSDAKEVLGNREACVARELTKKFQEAKLKPLDDLISHYHSNPAKGEIVLLFSGKSTDEFDIKEIEEEIIAMFQKGVSAKSITENLFEQYSESITKKELYIKVNALKKN